MSEVHTLINEVNQKIHDLETAQALYSRQLSPDFNTFDYINTDELGLSRILGALLDPKGSHAQQETFLKLFVEHCLPDMYKTPERQVFLNNLEKTDVLLEEVTGKSNTQRRMDIYLSCQVGDESYGICIENKPYAADQFEQLKDYAIELENRNHKAWHLVYLNESDEGPSKYSIDTNKLEALKKEKQYSHLRFSDLIGWLKACQVECQNHSVSEFIVQLIKFIQKQFMGIEDMSEDKAVLEIMTQNEESIKASIQISSHVDTMKKALIKKLIQDIKIKFAENYDNGSYQLDMSYIGDGKNYERISFTSSNFHKGYICFEFQNANFSYPCIGFKFDSREDVKSCVHAEKMKAILNAALTNKKIWHSPLWPAGYDFDLKDWRNSSQAWLMINEGIMADKILEEMDSIYVALEASDCFIK